MEKKKGTQGLASVHDLAKRREISSKGGKAAWAQGKAHKFTPEEARLAGKKGGRPKKKSNDVSRETYQFEISTNLKSPWDLFESMEPYDGNGISNPDLYE